MLNDLIKTHAEALSAWIASAAPGQDLETDCTSYEVFERAEYAFVTYQCLTAEEVQRKLAYVAECKTLADAVAVDLCNEFLDSLRLRPLETTGAELAQAVENWNISEERYRGEDRS
jgi:hypothetical protein